MSLVAWCKRSRRQFTVGALMVAVALGALAFDALRPPSRLEAERMAARHSDPSGRWRGRLRAVARPSFPEYWLVDITDTRSGEVASQISVSRWGRARDESVNVGYWKAGGPDRVR